MYLFSIQEIDVAINWLDNEVSKKGVNKHRKECHPEISAQDIMEISDIQKKIANTC